MKEQAEKKLEHGKSYDLGACNAVYDAHSDCFHGGNWFVHRSETHFKDWEGATLKWYKLERDGKIEVWQDGIPPTITGKMDFRLYEHRSEIGDGKFNWVKIDGIL